MALILGLIALSVSDGATKPSRTILASNVSDLIRDGLPAEFDNCIIVGDLNLSTLRIDEEVHFNNTLFQNSVNCKSTSFTKAAYFGDSKFNGGADFSSSNFNSIAGFSNSNFNGTAEFLSSSFDENTSFKGAQFSKDAYFSDTQFRKIADFKLSRFKESANFENTNFIMSAYFNRSHFADAFFEGALFQEYLSLNETKYNKFYVRWGYINRLAFDDTAYLLLIENFKNLGLSNDADSCYYTYRVERLLNSKMTNDPIAFELDLLSWIFLGFNVKPLYIISWAFYFILIFGIFWKIAGIGDNENQIDEYSFEVSKKTTFLEALNYSSIVFLSGYGVKFLTQQFIEPPLMPKRSKKFIRYSFILERMLGGMVSFFFSISSG